MPTISVVDTAFLNNFNLTNISIYSNLEEGSDRLTNSIAEDAIPGLSEIDTEFNEGLEETIKSVKDAVLDITQESKASSEELMTEVTSICQEYLESFDDEQEAFAEFTEKLANVFTEEGVNKVDEVLNNNLLESYERQLPTSGKNCRTI